MNAKTAHGDSPQDQWQACPEGELQRFSSQQKGRRRVRQAGRFTAVMALGMVLLGLTMYFLPSSSGHVDHMLEDYIAGKLTATEVERVESHLEVCPECRKAHDDLLRKLGRTALYNPVFVPLYFVAQFWAPACR